MCISVLTFPPPLAPPNHTDNPHTRHNHLKMASPATSSAAMVDAFRYVGRKTLRKLQGRSNENLTSAPDADSFGRSMMEKFGWKEGSGIGKNMDGMKDHLRAKKRGAEGLGSKGDGGMYEGDNAKSCLEDGWYLKVFDDAKKAKKLKKNKKSSKKRKRDEHDEESSSSFPAIPTDAELLKATGGARLGRRAQPRGGEVGKMKRIAAADAAYLAKFSGAAAAAAAAAPTVVEEEEEVPTASPKKKSKQEKKDAKALEFRWKKVIRQQIEEYYKDSTNLKLKRLKKNVVKIAKKEATLSKMSKEELKKKFDSKWRKMSKEEKARVEE